MEAVIKGQMKPMRQKTISGVDLTRKKSLEGKLSSKRKKSVSRKPRLSKRNDENWSGNVKKLGESSSDWLKQENVQLSQGAQAKLKYGQALRSNFSGISTMRSKRITQKPNACLLYTSPSPRDGLLSRMPSSA